MKLNTILILVFCIAVAIGFLYYFNKDDTTKEQDPKETPANLSSPPLPTEVEMIDQNIDEEDNNFEMLPPHDPQTLS